MFLCGELWHLVLWFYIGDDGGGVLLGGWYVRTLFFLSSHDGTTHPRLCGHDCLCVRDSSAGATKEIMDVLRQARNSSLSNIIISPLLYLGFQYRQLDVFQI